MRSVPPDGPERPKAPRPNGGLKKASVESGQAHAALVMDGEEGIAWAESVR
ncbi:MAG: hypothetical protein U0Q21_10100 [Dermatophilaceae bacterium]